MTNWVFNISSLRLLIALQNSMLKFWRNQCFFLLGTKKICELFHLKKLWTFKVIICLHYNANCVIMWKRQKKISDEQGSSKFLMYACLHLYRYMDTYIFSIGSPEIARFRKLSVIIAKIVSMAHEIKSLRKFITNKNTDSRDRKFAGSMLCDELVISIFNALFFFCDTDLYISVKFNERDE